MSNGDIIVGYGRVYEPKDGASIIYEIDDGVWKAQRLELTGDIGNNVKRSYFEGDVDFDMQVESVEKCIIDTVCNMMKIVDRIKRV